MADGEFTRMKPAPALLATLILCMAVTLSGCSDSGTPAKSPLPAPPTSPPSTAPIPVASAQATGLVGKKGTIIDTSTVDVFDSAIPVTTSKDAAFRLDAAEPEDAQNMLRQMSQGRKAFVVADGTAARCTGGDFRDVMQDRASQQGGFAVVKMLSGLHRGQSGWIPAYAFEAGSPHHVPADALPTTPIDPASEPQLRPQLPLGYAETSRKDDKDRSTVDSRFSEQERRQIYREIVQAEDSAEQDTYAQYPYPPDPPLNGTELDSYLVDQEKLNESLDEKHHARVRREHGLTEGQLNAISEEGVEGHWPNPDVKPSY